MRRGAQPQIPALEPRKRELEREVEGEVVWQTSGAGPSGAGLVLSSVSSPMHAMKQVHLLSVGSSAFGVSASGVYGSLLAPANQKEKTEDRCSRPYVAV